jgi:hypothetical protein
MYLEEKLTVEQIAEKLDCGTTTVWKHIYQFGLALDQEEQRQRKLARNAVRFADVRRKSGGDQFVKQAGHPLANKNGYVTEHRLTVERFIGRHVVKGEVIHHIDFDKQNNTIENLALLPNQAVHELVHRYIGMVGAFHSKLVKESPKPLQFYGKVLWGGNWITALDLINGNNEAAPVNELISKADHPAGRALEICEDVSESIAEALGRKSELEIVIN